MKKIILYSLLLFTLITTACAASNQTSKNSTTTTGESTMKNPKIFVKVAGKKISATLVDNKATRELLVRLRQNSLTVKTDDYGGFEKVGEFGSRLPTVDEQINTVPGDIILYQGTKICFYYSTNSWNFTRLGKLDLSSENEIREFLLAGKGRVDIVLSLD